MPIEHVDGTVERLADIRPDFSYDPTEPAPARRDVDLTLEDGTERRFEIEVPTATGFHLGAGLYFGWQGHHHGEWRGELHVDGERLADCSDPELARELHQIRDTVIHLRDPDTGAEGWGNCQPMVAGDHPDLGLTRRDVVLVVRSSQAPGNFTACEIVVLGAGFGGLELSTGLSEEFGDELDIVLIDQSDGFVFGFSKLDVMFGRTAAASGRPSLPWTSSSRACGSSRRRSGRSTRRPSASRPMPAPSTADVMVVALGADLDPSATPGLVEAGHEFYTVAGAFALREVLASFDGGDVIVGVTSTPFKCPPAPSETALLMHDYLTERGLRDDSVHLAGHAAWVCPSRRRRRRRRRCSWPSPSGASAGTPSGW